MNSKSSQVAQQTLRSAGCIDTHAVSSSESEEQKEKEVDLFWEIC